MDSVKIVKKDVKNISLKVKPNGEVILTAPMFVSDEHVEFVLNKRAKWIQTKQEFFANSKKLVKISNSSL